VLWRYSITLPPDLRLFLAPLLLRQTETCTITATSIESLLVCICHVLQSFSSGPGGIAAHLSAGAPTFVWQHMKKWVAPSWKLKLVHKRVTRATINVKICACSRVTFCFSCSETSSPVSLRGIWPWAQPGDFGLPEFLIWPPLRNCWIRPRGLHWRHSHRPSRGLYPQIL